MIGVTWKFLVFLGLAAVAHAVAYPLAYAVPLLLPVIKAQAVFQLIAAILLLPCAWICLRFFHRQSLAAIGIGPDRPWLMHTVIGTAIGAGLLTLGWGLLVVTGQATVSVNADASGRLTLAVVWAVYCLGISAQEELLFRGYPFQVVARWNPSVAVVFMGLFFVAIHLSNDGGFAPLSMLNIFFLHLLLVACYLRTRSLWLPIAVHAAWNYALAFVFGMPLSGRPVPQSIINTQVDPGLWTGNAFGPEGGLAVTMALGLAAAAVWRCLPQRRPAQDLMSAGVEPVLPTVTAD